MSIRIACLLPVAFSIALMLTGCGDRQETAQNAPASSETKVVQEEQSKVSPAELTVAAVEAHVKTMVEGLADVKVVEASPGHFTGTGSLDGRVYQIAVLRDGWMTRYELRSEVAGGHKTIQETVWSDGSSTETTRETLLKTPSGETSTESSTMSSVHGEPAYRATPAYQEHLRMMEDRHRKMEEMMKKKEAEKKAQEQKLEENP